MDRNCNVALAAVLSVAVASCADAQRTATPPTVIDSAGIRVVTNAWPGAAAASVSGAPLVDIGGGADAASQLTYVVAAVRLRDGRLAIAEQGVRSIKIFDTRGRFVRAIGREGPGPGEFSSITRLELLPGDLLAAYDGLRTTLTVFDTTGRVVRSERLAAGPGGLRMEGLLGDGTMVLSRAYNTMFGRTSRLERDSITYVAIRPPATVADTIIQVAGTDIYMFAGEGFSSRREVPFGRRSGIAVARDRIYTGTADAWQIASHAPDGRLLALHRVRQTPTPVTKPEIARFKREYLERTKSMRVQAAGGGGGPDMRSAMMAQDQRMLEQVPYPEFHAPYDSLVVGASDELWVRSAHPFAGEPSTWIVLTRDGAALGKVTLPGGMRLLQAGADFVVGLTKDADDVEHVGVYPLRRTEASGGR